MSSYPESVLNTAQNISTRPDGSRFFLGETVLHMPTNQMYTVCDLGHFESDYYGLWPLGCVCAVPTHGAFGSTLCAIASE